MKMFKKNLFFLFSLFLIAGILNSTAVISLAANPPSTTVSFIDNYENYWPLWPRPKEIQNPKKEDLKDPFSFTTVGRDILNWVDFEMPLNNNEEITPADVIWGMSLSTIDFSEKSPDVYQDSLSSYSTNAYKVYFYDQSQYERKKITSANLLSFIKDYSVFPEYKKPWVVVSEGEDLINYANQASDVLWRESAWEWIDFMQSSVSRYDDGYRNYYMADSGNGTPFTLYPDNGWLLSMGGYSSYLSDVIKDIYTSDSWGDAIVILNSNEGLLRFFNVSGNQVKQEFAVMPSPAFQYSIYQDHLKELDGTNTPRITVLDGPVTVNDIQKPGHSSSGSKNDWLRIAVGTLGMGQNLKEKPSRAWDAEKEIDLSGESVPKIEGHLAGIYAVDITNLNKTDIDSDMTADPSELWSVSNTYISSSEGVSTGSYLDVYVNGYDTDAASSYELYKTLQYSPTRPVFGYTQDGDKNIWHTIVAGIDISDKHRIYDIKAANGAVFSAPQLDSRSLQDEEIVEDAYPTRIATYIPLGESTPLLSNVYFHLSEGSFYHWDIVSGSTPEKLFKTIYAAPNLGSDNGIPSATDFDVTEIKVGSEFHKMAAVVVDVNRAGEHDQAKVLVVVDLDEITLGDPKEVDLYNGISNFSAGDWTSKGIDTVYPLYYDDAYADDYSEGFMVWLGGGIYDSSNPKRRDVAVSSPIFYDGKIVLSVFQWEEESSETSDYESSVYAVDVATWLAKGSSVPDNTTMTEDEMEQYRILDGGGELVTYDQEEFIGGASITDNGEEVVFNTVIRTSSGTEGKDINLTDLLGVESISESLGSSYETGDMFVSHWKVID